MCNKCNKCKYCKKNLTYYRGLPDNQIKFYNKKRVRVEHLISHYKHGRTQDVKDKKLKICKRLF